ncbi:PAS domain S-box protein [Alkalicoccus daliensis]|uniref:PAS domain S-box-containing protein n=1 Tax=Alkalicoccus daliensis TaxID=745820 RepID=A0A1H0E5U0_9BACI|nr:PAS domain S-box protein [Alkalicoccus daliensis]SDN77807.1 PAS domain S-box-containing protein [Alkalicoccus daliensis]
MNNVISKIDYTEVMEYSLTPLILHTDYKILYINHAAEEFFGTIKEEITGFNPLDIFKETSKALIKKRIQSAYGAPAEVIEETIFKMDGSTVDVELYCHPIMIDGQKAIQTYVRDVTEQKLAEKKQLQMMAQVNELSATLVPLGNELAVLPLVGDFDDLRARKLLEVLPEKVQAQKISYVILDFSGIYSLDKVVADYLFKIYNVLALLGVQSIITGLRPESAMVAVNLDLDFSAIPTMATVKDALVYFETEVKK